MTQSYLHQLAATLAPFGFSEIEALIYGFLLREGPATGYRVSHGIAKPTANTYKAIRTLAERGALTVEDSHTRLCRAVPPEELLSRLERQFQVQKGQAAERLSRLHRENGDDRVYQLESAEQVLERARVMLGRATQIALLDVFPQPLEALKADLAAASRRGVTIALQCYAPISLPGILVVQNDLSPELMDSWPGLQLSLVVDAQEHLLALLSKDGQGVHQAIWSTSTFLSCMQHNHLACELRLNILDSKLGEKAQSAFQQISLLRADPPGLRTLKRRFQG